MGEAVTSDANQMVRIISVCRNNRVIVWFGDLIRQHNAGICVQFYGNENKHGRESDT